MSLRLQQLFNTAQARLWLRFMLPGLVALLCFAWPNQARGNCGYYVIIGHPSPQTAAEQASVPRMPRLHQQCPCHGPQCRKQDRPMTPVQAVTIGVQEPMALMAGGPPPIEMNLRFACRDKVCFLSEPHIWHIDPPPRS